MAGANGPTSAAGTPEVPNPLGGAEKPAGGDGKRPDGEAVEVERPLDGAKAGGEPAQRGEEQG